MAIGKASIVINRPLKEVCDYLDDPANSPEWEGNILESEKTSEGPTQVGTTYRGLASFLGRRLEWSSEVTEFELHSRIKQKVTVGPLLVERTYILEPVEGGTRFTVIMEGEPEGPPRGFFRLADPIVLRLLQRDMEADVARLKDILEAEG